MTKKYWIAGLLGGLATYVWMSIAHVASPLGAVGIQTIPGEQPVLSAFTAVLGDKAGLYLFPAMEGSMADYEKKLAASPSGLLVYRAPGAAPMTPGQLIGELAVEMLLVLLAVWVLSKTTITGFGGRLGFFFVTGLLAALWTNVSYAVWYSFPPLYTLVNIGTELIGFLAAGIVVAAMLRRI